MNDSELIGYWSDSTVDPHAVENSELGFREDGTGWMYWVSWSGSFCVQRFTWAVPAPGILELRFTLILSGTWDGDGGHQVEEREAADSRIALGYVIEGGTVLNCDRPVEPGLTGTRFARDRCTADPTL